MLLSVQDEVEMSYCNPIEVGDQSQAGCLPERSSSVLRPQLTVGQGSPRMDYFSRQTRSYTKGCLGTHQNMW